MIKRIIQPGAALALLLLWCTDVHGLFPCFFWAAAVHEAGHLAALRFFGLRPRSLRLGAGGLVIDYCASLSHRRDAAVALAGPAAGAVFWLLCALLTAGSVFPQRGRSYAGASLALSLFNLIPAYPLDGAQALYSVLAARLTPPEAERIVRIVTVSVGAAMFAAGLYILVKTRYNISMLACSGLIIGGLYAKRSGKSPAEGTETRPLRRRRVRADKEEYR